MEITININVYGDNNMVIVNVTKCEDKAILNITEGESKKEIIIELIK